MSPLRSKTASQSSSSESCQPVSVPSGAEPVPGSTVLERAWRASHQELGRLKPPQLDRKRTRAAARVARSIGSCVRCFRELGSNSHRNESQSPALYGPSPRRRPARERKERRSLGRIRSEPTQARLTRPFSDNAFNRRCPLANATKLKMDVRDRGRPTGISSNSR
jgi:hypothetical protein